MAVTINTNIAPVSAQRNLNKVTAALSKSFERLSSGSRLNRAGDDAAGLAIADGMSAQISGLGQKIRNANDGISMAQTAEGGLDQISKGLLRMRELSMQAANATLSGEQRGILDGEFQELSQEIGRIISGTEFNGTAVLQDGGVEVGDPGEAVTVTANVDVSGLEGATLVSSTQATAAMHAIDQTMDAVSGIRADLGTAQNRLASRISNLQNTSGNLSAARSRIMDTDVAAETAAMTRSLILLQADVAISSRANENQQLALQLLG